MKTKFRLICAAFILLAVTLTGCASKKGELQEINDEDFSPKLILIASGTQRLVKFEIDKNQLLPDVDSKSIKAAEIKIEFYSGRKPGENAKDGTPVATVTFDLLKDADKLIKGYDLMANAKELKTSAQDLNKAFSAARYYYAKGSFEVTVKESKLVTKTKTIFSNDTVYTPLEETSSSSNVNYSDAK